VFLLQIISAQIILSYSTTSTGCQEILLSQNLFKSLLSRLSDPYCGDIVSMIVLELSLREISNGVILNINNLYKLFSTFKEDDRFWTTTLSLSIMQSLVYGCPTSFQTIFDQIVNYLNNIFPLVLSKYFDHKVWELNKSYCTGDDAREEAMPKCKFYAIH